MSQEYINCLSSDYAVIQTDGLYHIRALFRFTSFEAMPDPVTNLRVNQKVHVTKVTEVAMRLAGMDDMIRSTYEFETTVPLKRNDEIWVDLFPEDEYEECHESSLEIQLLESRSESEITAGAGLSGGGDMTIRMQDPTKTLLNIDPDGFLTFYTNGEPAVTINTNTGAVTLDQDQDYEVGAMQFWSAVAVAFPNMFEHVPKTEAIEEAVQYNAYDRAMGVLKDNG